MNSTGNMSDIYGVINTVNKELMMIIPQVINDRNHWMLGVDVVDQLTAYYCSKI